MVEVIVTASAGFSSGGVVKRIDSVVGTVLIGLSCFVINLIGIHKVLKAVLNSVGGALAVVYSLRGCTVPVEVYVILSAL